MATNIDLQNAYSPLQTNFNRKYILDGSYIPLLVELLCEKTFWDDISLLFANPSDFVVGLTWYPFNIKDFTDGNFEQVIFANKTISQVSGYRIPQRYSMVKLVAEIDIQRSFNNFMDYAPYTQIQIWLPYLGFYDLPVNEVMGKKLQIYYALDYENAMGTAFLQVDNHVIMTCSGRIGIEIPVGASNKNEVAKQNLMNAGKLVSGVAGIVAGGIAGKTTGALMVAGGVKTALTSGIDSITANQIRYNRGNASGGSENIASPDSVYIIITRPDPIRIDTDLYRKTKGFPVGKVLRMSQCLGFTIVGEVHLDGFETATDTEIKMIEDSLHKGVIF